MKAGSDAVAIVTRCQTPGVGFLAGPRKHASGGRWRIDTTVWIKSSKVGICDIILASESCRVSHVAAPRGERCETLEDPMRSRPDPDNGLQCMLHARLINRRSDSA